MLHFIQHQTSVTAKDASWGDMKRYKIRALGGGKPGGPAALGIVSSSLPDARQEGQGSGVLGSQLGACLPLKLSSPGRGPIVCLAPCSDPSLHATLGSSVACGTVGTLVARIPVWLLPYCGAVQLQPIS